MKHLFQSTVIEETFNFLLSPRLYEQFKALDKFLCYFLNYNFWVFTLIECVRGKELEQENN